MMNLGHLVPEQNKETKHFNDIYFFNMYYSVNKKNFLSP